MQCLYIVVLYIVRLLSFCLNKKLYLLLRTWQYLQLISRLHEFQHVSTVSCITANEKFILVYIGKKTLPRFMLFLLYYWIYVEEHREHRVVKEEDLTTRITHLYTRRDRALLHLFYNLRINTHAHVWMWQ